MVDLIIDFFIKIYRTVGIQGFGIGLVLLIAAVWLSIYFRRKLNPFTRAEKFYNAGHLKRAFSFLMIELERNPTNKKALHMKADIHLKREEYEQAERYYYRLIDLKRSGDGIDPFKIKQSLLRSLYRQNKLLELYKLSKDILNTERNNAEALYYFALLYMGQLYYKEACRILDRLIAIRPNMHEAHFAHAVASAQLKKFDESLISIKRALEMQKCTLYELALATCYFFIENYAESKGILVKHNIIEKNFDTIEQYVLSLRVLAFCNLKQSLFADALKVFKRLYDIARENEGKSEEDVVVYDEFGKKRESQVKRKDVKEDKKSPLVEEYYKLKEFAIDGGYEIGMRRESIASSGRFLDLEGITKKTRAALELGFAMIRAGQREEALLFFNEMRKANPEVIGINRIIELINNGREAEREEKIVSKKKGYELGEYLDLWEKEGIRPYSLIMAAGFSTRKQLSPLLLFSRDGKFSLEF
jgi:tetratricopeptide (TPR) repeat protein